ncbi:ectoine hydroxylase-related dioxygenase (phytanoyl-CoA dioxygenase family) [Sphingomonas kyeonggiensis]|uniref:Ectoine hydroxylase-related dioxygenase (Phytanoyl-CoA dioxygenase family) n=1 Tax=Sphingomonas kyeonggiensis TaxID=1268553 RepID=A0A7W7JZF4_9SPHN|nr:phytanoyl-CoA dioxygenase family protein [Sphingomonas kyeonggiensis]MBB4838199.1 ectoine hydroxylase-related dioxygenase (phytanoyl-CoA dioxygenase family) [Sphingomonas kyeonggiensis]
MIDSAMPLSLERDGAEHLRGAALAARDRIEAALAGLPVDRPGLRLREITDLPDLLEAQGTIGRIAARWLGPDTQPVRAILFDKNDRTNWALGWHQDRTIAVTARCDVPGFGPWTIKHGMHHVAPPFALLAGMLTLRVHLDPVPLDNAPLLVAPGSHRTLVAESDIERMVAAHGIHACVAEPGDIWAYATPILHASNAATRPKRRRVLQVDYAATALPGGLSWLGI